MSMRDFFKSQFFAIVISLSAAIIFAFASQGAHAALYEKNVRVTAPTQDVNGNSISGPLTILVHYGLSPGDYSSGSFIATGVQPGSTILVPVQVDVSTEAVTAHIAATARNQDAEVSAYSAPIRQTFRVEQLLIETVPPVIEFEAGEDWRLVGGCPVGYRCRLILEPEQ